MNIFVIGSYVQGYCWHLDNIPQAGETRIAESLSIEAGGKGLNVAVCTKRLGANTDALFGIGDDGAGKVLMNLLEQEHITTSHTHIVAQQSGSAVGMIAKNGQNAIAVLPAANLQLDESHVNNAFDVIRASDIVYGQFECAQAVIEASFILAKSNQAKTVLNPSPWQTIKPDLLNNADIIIVNEVEVLHLLNIVGTLSDSVQMTALEIGVLSLIDWQNLLLKEIDPLLQRWQGELLVVTLGVLGCIAIDRQKSCFSVPAFQVNAVDTICCGDAFASGFCVQYLQKPLLATLTFASACGALTAQNSGMLASLPRLSQVEAFLASTSLTS